MSGSRSGDPGPPVAEGSAQERGCRIKEEAEVLMKQTPFFGGVKEVREAPAAYVIIANYCNWTSSWQEYLGPEVKPVCFRSFFQLSRGALSR